MSLYITHGRNFLKVEIITGLNKFYIDNNTSSNALKEKVSITRIKP